MGLLTGKTALIVGIASNRSIAYGIAKAFYEQGATLAFTYQNEKLKPRVEKFAEEFTQQGNTPIVLPCDVSSDNEINSVFDSLNSHWSNLDILIHSVGFAPANELDGELSESCTREGFQIAHDISSYSLIALSKAAKPLLKPSSSIITLTYHGSQQTLPNYNVMGLAKASLEAGVRYLANDLGHNGVRVNSISAGPIKTLAAAGIKSFRKMLSINKERSALQRNVSIEEVGNTAVFLASDMASGITGENIYVDAGFRSCAISKQEM